MLLRPSPSPDGRGLLVAADLVRSDLPDLRAVRIGGGTHGRLDLPAQAHRRTGGDLSMGDDRARGLAAGRLPDGRPLRFEIRLPGYAKRTE